MKQSSLVRRVIVGVLLAELVCAVLLSGITLAHDVHLRQRAFDVMLRGRADSVLGAVRDSERNDDSAEVDPSELQLPLQDMFVVLDASGQVIGQSRGLSADARTQLSAPRSTGYFPLRTSRGGFRGIRMAGVRVIDRDNNGGVRRPVAIVYASPTHYLWHEAVEDVEFDVTSGVILLALTGGGLAWYLRRRLTPLEDLAAMAERVSPHSWDFEPPAAVSQIHELSPIAESIKKLLDGLRAAFDRERRLTGDAAHELKTSIAVLKSSLQLLLMKPRSASEYEQGLEGVLLDTERTEDLANRMLALARLEESPVEETGGSDLAYAAGCLLDRLRPLAELKRIGIASDIAPGATVAITPEDAEVLCSNLMMNALQHTREDGSILIVVRKQNESVELEISDNGEGIPEAALPHVFDRFYRADSSRSRQSGGAGLGLSICKAIVERGNGQIELRSTAGMGTEVTVTLPWSAKRSVKQEPEANFEKVPDYLEGSV